MHMQANSLGLRRPGLLSPAAPLSPTPPSRTHLFPLPVERALERPHRAVLLGLQKCELEAEGTRSEQAPGQRKWAILEEHLDRLVPLLQSSRRVASSWAHSRKRANAPPGDSDGTQATS
eukprot:1160628-Pelagomonas_calceolata.AAC.6